MYYKLTLLFMEYALWAIRIGAASTMLAFGVHQMRKPQDWFGYMPESLKKLSFIKPEAEMRIHALVNIAFGLFLLSSLFPLIAAWVAFIWWLSIVPLAFKVRWQIGMRDLSVTFSILALIFLLS